MNSSAEKRTWRLSLVEMLIVVAISGMVAALVLPVPHRKPSQARFKLTQMDMASLAGALNQYRVKYGAYPPGGFTAMVEPLMGSNSHQTNFLERIFRNDREEPIDYWLTPYRIETNQTNGLSIRSAGPNCRFGDADDLEQSL